jgi:acyl carrier protein
MNPESSAIESEVRRLILLVLKVPADKYATLLRADIAEWDSLKHMELVFALEDRFDVQFHEDEFVDLDSSSAIAARIQSRQAQPRRAP